MSTPPVPAPRSSGYLATSVGALLGWLVLGGPGTAIGVGVMQLLFEPRAGLANLWLLIFPMVLGGLGVIAGTYLGIRRALRRYGHTHADETARVGVGLAIACLVLTPYGGIGLVLLLGAPAAARRLTLRRRAGPAIT